MTRRTASVSLSAPIGDLFKVGVSGARLSRGGFGDNINSRHREL